MKVNISIFIYAKSSATLIYLSCIGYAHKENFFVVVFSIWHEQPYSIALLYRSTLSEMYFVEAVSEFFNFANTVLCAYTSSCHVVSYHFSEQRVLGTNLKCNGSALRLSSSINDKALALLDFQLFVKVNFKCRPALRICIYPAAHSSKPDLICFCPWSFKGFSQLCLIHIVINTRKSTSSLVNRAVQLFYSDNINAVGFKVVFRQNNIC